MNQPEQTDVGFVDIELVHRFNDNWRGEKDSLPEFAEQLNESTTDANRRRDTIVQLVVSDISRRWKALGAGELKTRPPEAISYLDQFAQLIGSDIGPQVAILVAEFEARFHAKDHPKISEYEQSLCDRPSVLNGLKAQVTNRFHGTLEDTHAPRTNDASTMASDVRVYSTKPANTPRMLGDYELQGELARGGMGVVFRAVHSKLRRQVALKMILAGQLAGEQEVKRFYSEAEAAANLDHPGIVPIYEVGQADGNHFFTMALVEGSSLHARIQQGPMPAREAAQFLREVSAAVAYAHDKGIIHRDLKPSNILINEAGMPRVTDFGLAKSVKADSGITATGQVLGTPNYMPPEQALGQIHNVDQQSDVYSLGAVLYCMLTGRPPHTGSSVLETLRHVTEQPIVAPRLLSPSVDKDLETICLKCLEKKKQDRFGTADDLTAELDRYLSGQPILSRRIGLATRAVRWARRRPLVVAAVACLLVAIVAGYAAISAGRAATETKHLANANDRFLQTLESLKPNAASWRDASQSITAIESLSEQAANDARLQLQTKFAGVLDVRLRQPRLNRDSLDALEPLIEHVAKTDADELRTLLQQRRSDWQLIATHQSTSLFDPSLVREHAQGLQSLAPQRLIETTGAREKYKGRPAAPVVASTLNCEGDTRAIVTLDASYDQFPEIGIQLRHTDRGGYGFVIGVARLFGTSDKATIRGSLENDEAVVCEIRRGETALVQRTLTLGDLPAGPIKIEAIASGDSLEFRLPGAEPLKFQDPFPLIGNVGVFGLRAPQNAIVSDLQVFTRSVANISPLEQAEKELALGRFAEAAKMFREQAAATSDVSLRQESSFKEARCLIELREDEAAEKILQGLATQQGERWPPLAGVHLWAIYLNRNDAASATEMQNFIQRRYEFSELASLIPESLRLQILRKAMSAYRSVGATFRHDPTWFQEMKRAGKVDRLLSRNGNGMPNTQIQLALAYRLAGEYENARITLQPHLNDVQDPFHDHMCRQYVRCLLRLGRAEEAIEVLTKIIENGNHVRPLTTLHNSRAWSHVATGNYVAARHDARRAVVLCQSEHRSSDFEIVVARFLLGALAHREGNRSEAHRQWKLGHEAGRALITTLDSLANTSALFSLVQGGLIGDVTREDIDLYLKIGAGRKENTQLVAFGKAFNAQTIASAVNHAFQTPEGVENAMDLAFDRLPIDERFRSPAVLMGASILAVSAIGNDFSSENLQVFRALSDSMMDGYLVEGSLGGPQLIQFGMAWKGMTNFLGWGGLKTTLPKPRVGLVAYAMAHRYARKSQTADVGPALRDAIAGLDDLPNLKKIAERDLQLWNDDQALVKLSVKDAPSDMSLEILKQKKIVRTITDLSSDTNVELPPGDYQLRVAGAEAKSIVSISPAQVKLSRGSSRDVRVGLKTVMPKQNVVPGLILRPSVDGDGRVEQLYRPYPDWARLIEWSPDGSKLAVADRSQGILIYDAATAKPLYHLVGHRNQIRTISWAAGGGLITTSHDTAIAWDVQRRQIRGQVSSLNDRFENIASNPHKPWVAIGGTKDVFLWNVETNEMTTVYGGQSTWNLGVNWSTSGEQVTFNFFSDLGARALDVTSRKLTKFIPADSSLRKVRGRAPVFSPDEQWVAERRDSVLSVWNVDDPQRPRFTEKVEPNGFPVVWSQRGKGFAVVEASGARVFSPESGKWAKLDTEIAGGNHGTIHPKTGAVARAGGDARWEQPGKNDDSKWNVVRTQRPNIEVHDASWSKPGQLCVAASKGGLLQLNLEDNQVSTLNDSVRPLLVDWQRDGSELVCASDNRLYRINSDGKILAEKEMQGRLRASQLEWHPGGSHFAIVRAEKQLSIHDSKSLQAVKRAPAETANLIKDIDWHRTRRDLVVGRSEAPIKVLTVDNELVRERGRQSQCSIVTWSGDDVIAGQHTALSRFKRDGGEIIVPKDHDDEYLRRICIDPNSSHLTTVWGDGTIRRYDAGRLIQRSDCSQHIHRVIYRPGYPEIAIVTTYGTIEFFDWQTLAPIRIFVLLDKDNWAWLDPLGETIKATKDIDSYFLRQQFALVKDKSP